MKTLALALVTIFATTVYGSSFTSISTFTNNDLDQIATIWETIASAITDNQIGDYSDCTNFESQKYKYVSSNTKKVAQDLWYTYSESDEYDVELRNVNKSFNAQKIKAIFEYLVTAGDGNVFFPKDIYNQMNQLARLTNSLEGKTSIYIARQSFADGTYYGIVILDQENKEAVVLGGLFGI